MRDNRYIPSHPPLDTLTLKSLAYWNGTWVPLAEISIPLDDFGFLMGISVIERLRTFGGKLFRAEQHLGRLRRSMEILGWDAEQLSQEVAAVLEEFIERNASLIADGDDWSISIFVTPGKSASAEKPTVCVHGSPLPFQDWSKQFEAGVHAVIVNTRQIPGNCWPAELKCRSRMHYYLADREAEARQPGARAILLDQDGFVGEGSTANVVAYFADRGLVTPLRSKVLPGVSQEVLYELADSLGVAHCEADLLPAELAKADEIFFTSTSVCLLAVVELDGKKVGNGKPGEMYGRLLLAWSELVGIDIARQSEQFCDRVLPERN